MEQILNKLSEIEATANAIMQDAARQKQALSEEAEKQIKDFDASLETKTSAEIRKIREDLETWLGERYTGISELLMRLRPLVLALHHETRQNTTLFRSIVDSPLSEALQRRDRQTCESLLRELLPIELHPYIMELLHDLA